MNCKQLVSLIIIVSLLLTGWLLYSGQTAKPSLSVSHPEPEPAVSTVEVSATTAAEPISDGVEHHQPLAELTEQQQGSAVAAATDKSACAALSKQIDTHPLFKDFIAWNEQVSPNITHTLHDERSMDQLMLEAQAGDVLAMRTLSRNYRWYALYGHYSTPDASQEVNPDIDTSALAKARYWMEQAGLHGYAGAFFQLATFTQAETQVLIQAEKSGRLSKDEFAERMEENDLRTLTYFRLALQMMPNMRDHLYALELMLPKQALPEPRQKLFDDMYQQLEREWRSKRELLGLPAELDIAVPAEFAELVQLNKAKMQCYMR